MQIATILLLVSAALCQTPDTLDVATITGRKALVLSAAAPIQHADSAMLQNTGAISLNEALRSFASVSVKDYGGLGGMKSVSIRSFGAQHTGIIYDGMVISNAQNGQVDIGRFNLDDISRISVEISGSSDILRPARAASYVGVMSIQSARPSFTDKGTLFSAGLRQSSFNTWNPYLSLAQRIGNNWRASLRANYINSRGNYPFILRNGSRSSEQTRLHSDVSSLNAEASVHGMVHDRGEVDIKFSTYHSERGLPGSVVLYTQNPHQRLWDRDYRASASYDASFGERWKVKAGASYSSAWNRFVDYDPIHPEPEDDRYLQQEGSLSAAALIMVIRGLEFSAAQDLVFNHLDANIASNQQPSRLTSYTALSGKYEHGPLCVTATILATAYSQWVKSGNPGAGRAHLSPSVGISWRLPLKSDLRLRASFKDSFRQPTFNDLYYQKIGNRDLRPEKALQTNVGAVWNHSFGSHSLGISADAYWNSVRDKIVAVPSLFIWSMRNVGKVTMLGTDLSLRYEGRLCRWISVDAGANYSYQYAVDVTDPGAKNYRHQIAYTPRHHGSGTFVVKTPWFNLGYTLQAVGERFTLAQNTDAYRAEPYADHCLSINHTFNLGRRHVWRLHLSAEALNLGGENYEVIRYYPMPGRQYRISVKISY